ncbi:MAG: ribosomal protein S18-alanine N-acetyltransferase [Spirulinaceae cyanobacterium]
MTLSELVLEPLKPEQLSLAVELDKLCLGGLWSLEGYQRELVSPNSQFLVISRNSATASQQNLIGLGCFWAILEEAHITLLAVHPDYQSQGLGQLLLINLLKQARFRNLERATLEVRETNQAALSIYQKFGFQIAGKRRGYYQKTNEDALILWLNHLQTEEFARKLAILSQKNHQCLVFSGWEIRAIPTSV